MDAIASCYIGGAATSGGIGTIIGAVVEHLSWNLKQRNVSLRLVYGYSENRKRSCITRSGYG